MPAASTLESPALQHLPPLQAEFCNEYLVDLHGTNAAIRAGYSRKTAAAQASRLLKNVKIREALIARRTELATAHDITPERVLKEYAAVAFTRITDYMDIGPGGITLKSLEGIDTRAIAEASETKTEQGGAIKIKLHNKIAALHDLAEHLGLFKRPEVPLAQGDFIIHYRAPDGAPPPTKVRMAIDL